MSPTPRTDRGQSQISTLIVFIAMMLIVTMTAGVVFDLAGALQLRSEDTGQRSNEQVVEHLDPIATTGVLNPSDQVESVEIVARKPAGAGVINVSGVAVQVLSSQGVDRLNPSSPGLTVSALQDDDTSLQGAPLIMNSRTDRVQLTVSLSTIQSNGGENGPWDPGETATIRLDAGGRVTVLDLRVPDYVGDASTVAL